MFQPCTHLSAIRAFDVLCILGRCGKVWSEGFFGRHLSRSGLFVYRLLLRMATLNRNTQVSLLGRENPCSSSSFQTPPPRLGMGHWNSFHTWRVRMLDRLFLHVSHSGLVSSRWPMPYRHTAPRHYIVHFVRCHSQHIPYSDFHLSPESFDTIQNSPCEGISSDALCRLLRRHFEATQRNRWYPTS